jgi:hypothetical protein
LYCSVKFESQFYSLVSVWLSASPLLYIYLLYTYLLYIYLLYIYLFTYYVFIYSYTDVCTAGPAAGLGGPGARAMQGRLRDRAAGSASEFRVIQNIASQK